jgi:hypothetical protein
MAVAEDPEDHGAIDITKLSDEQISKRLKNPPTKLWSITVQENYANYKGDAVNGDLPTFAAGAPKKNPCRGAFRGQSGAC